MIPIDKERIFIELLPEVNNLIALTWPHEDFFSFAKYLLKKIISNILESNPTLARSDLKKVAYAQVVSIIPILSHDIQLNLNKVDPLKWQYYGETFYFSNK